jgi:hypothetical protein
MGTIRGREAREVIKDVIASKGLPSGIWSMSPSGILSMLIGHREWKCEVKRGLSYYALTDLRRRVEVACDEAIANRKSRQIDLEEAIKASRDLQAAE